MRRRVNRVSGSATAALFILALPLTITEGTRLVGGELIIGFLWGAVVAACLVWVLSTGVVWKRIPWTVTRKNTLATRRISERALGRRVLAMSEALDEELAEFHKTNPRTIAWQTSTYGTGNLDKQQRAENRHQAQFVARFIGKYRGEATYLLNELLGRQRIDESEKWRFDHMGQSVTDIEELARLFASVGHRLTEKENEEE